MKAYPQNSTGYLYRYKGFSNNDIIKKFLNEFDGKPLRKTFSKNINQSNDLNSLSFSTLNSTLNTSGVRHQAGMSVSIRDNERFKEIFKTPSKKSKMSLNDRLNNTLNLMHMRYRDTNSNHYLYANRYRFRSVYNYNKRAQSIFDGNVSSIGARLKVSEYKKMFGIK